MVEDLILQEIRGAAEAEGPEVLGTSASQLMVTGILKLQVISSVVSDKVVSECG
jgi:hypothetical protein